MKNYSLVAWGLSLGMLVSGAAVAASQTSVDVSGTVTPAACNIALANNGNFNFGKISAADVDRQDTTRFRPIETTLRLDCAAGTSVAVSLVDMDFASQVPITFPDYVGWPEMMETIVSGIGYHDGKKIGGFMVELNPRDYQDGTTPMTLWNKIGSGGWSDTVTMRLGLNRMISFGDATGPLPVSDVTGTLRVSMGIAHDQGLTFENEIDINAGATLELVYL